MIGLRAGWDGIDHRTQSRGRSLQTVLYGTASDAIFRPFRGLGIAAVPKSDLDTIDCRIVAELQADARLSNVALAEKVGLSPSPCLRRVKRLERDGVHRRLSSSLAT